MLYPQHFTLLTLFTTLLSVPRTHAQNSQTITNTTTTPALNLTAISTYNDASVIECWQMQPNFTLTTQPGVSGSLSLFLGNTVNASYLAIPPRFDGGLHNAPVGQYVIYLSGMAHITLPNTTVSPKTEAWIHGGKYGLVIAADVKGMSKYGHETSYPTNANTVTLTIPFAGGKIPDHTVLYEGPCLWPEMVGI